VLDREIKNKRMLDRKIKKKNVFKIKI